MKESGWGSVAADKSPWVAASMASPPAGRKARREKVEKGKGGKRTQTQMSINYISYIERYAT
jgi:hypothetical protein